MDCEPGCDHRSHYLDPRTLGGMLERGLGRGAERAVQDPAGPHAVREALGRDGRWFTALDERAVYFTRLVRDLGLSVSAVTDPLGRADDLDADLLLDVLGLLGRCGRADAVDAVRAYVREGEQWVEALEAVASVWPAQWWNDLLPVAYARADAGTCRVIRRYTAPWPAWAARDKWAADLVDRAEELWTQQPAPRPYAAVPPADLVVLAAATDDPETQRTLQQELQHRPDPVALGLAEVLPRGLLTGHFRTMVDRLGKAAVPAARRWVTDPTDPLYWTGCVVLAEHGDLTDAPAMTAAVAWLDSRSGNYCGYDRLIVGLLRVGAEGHDPLVRRIRRLWFSPHTMERATYLRALVTFKADGAVGHLTEALWDCEQDVRLIGVHQAPLNSTVRERLRYLRDDPIEAADVRAAAAQRLSSDTR